MLIKQLSYYLTFGLSCGGKKMKFDDIYPILLTGQVVKRKSNFKGFYSEWYWKVIDGKVMHKLPYLVEWEEYYFEKEDFIANDWEIVSDEELSYQLQYYNL